MAQTLETIENPVTHDRVSFRTAAPDEMGAILEFDDFLLEAGLAMTIRIMEGLRGAPVDQLTFAQLFYRRLQ
jgi:hypothetical protein